MTNSAAYVARVGGLAVALGIGAAVASSQQVAWADSPDLPSDASGASTSSSTHSESSSGSSGPSGHRSPDSSTTANTISDGPSPSGSTTDSDDSNVGPVDNGSPASDPDTETPAADTPPASKPDTDIADSPRPHLPSRHRSTARSQAHPQADVKPTSDPETQSPSTSSAGTADVGQTTVETDTTAVSAVSAKAVQSTQLDMSPATVKADEDQPVIAESAPEARASSTAAPQVVTSLLAAVGLSPLATDSPAAPVAPPPTLFGALEWIRRDILKTFFNQAPTIAYNPAQNSLADGNIVGKLTVKDPDGTGYTLTATKPAKGEVVVNPDGTFVYTPGPDFDGGDTFKVIATEADGGFHIHGLSGLLNLVTFGLLGQSGHATTYTVNVGARFERSTVVAGLDGPTDFRFLPDDRILVAEKGGAIKVYDGSQLQSDPLFTFPTSTLWARGVNGIEVDPNFADNGYVYVSYIADDNIERLSRITVAEPSAEVLTVVPDSFVVLVEGTEPAGDDHHGGGLRFGPDDKLYWSVGDNTCCTAIDDHNAQSLETMYGKVLRLNPDGTAPTDNPFNDGAGPNYDAIYATGFRNPFRLTFAGDKLLVADVGQDTWEEVNLVTAGANYGWPNAEGPCDGIGVSDCATPSVDTNPIYAYQHVGFSSITGVLVYTDSEFGPEYQNNVFIADFQQGWIKRLTCDSSLTSCGNETMFYAQAGPIVSLQQGPDGSIYALTLDGNLSRIARTDVGSPIV